MCKFPAGDQFNSAAAGRSSANTASSEANTSAGIEMPVNSLISPIVSPLPRSFYSLDAAAVARDLLGKIILHRIGQSQVCARIVETEAYVQTYLRQPDLAAHSAAGITPRTRVIFGPPGHAYVYLSYGVHHCLNIVAEPEGTPGCVLIRAVEPISGIALPTNGPGKLTRALGITLKHYGRDLTQGDFILFDAPPPDEIRTTRRIGISKSPDFPLRFHIAGNPHVSR